MYFKLFSNDKNYFSVKSSTEKNIKLPTQNGGRAVIIKRKIYL